MNLSDILFTRTVVGDLEKSLDAYTLRQKAINNNIANAMTPGYKAQKVSFEEDYRKSLEVARLKGTMTNQHHIPIPGNKVQPHPRLELKEDTLNDTGLNNVDIDREMAEMAENALRYEMSTKLLNKRFSGLRKAISGRV